MIDTTKLHQIPDWANLVLAALLFIAPWFPGFADHMTAAWNAWITAVVIAALAIAALVQFAVWEEWVEAVLGIWLFVAPWILDFSAVQAATWTHAVLGVLVAVFAVWRGALAHYGGGRQAHA
jgi:hypothetical protein